MGLRNFIVVVVCFVVLGIVGPGCNANEQRLSPDAVAELLLSDARDNLMILESISNSDDLSDHEITSIVADSLVRKVMVLRAVPYKVNDVRGRALETLCLLSEDEALFWIMQSSKTEISELAVAYVSELERDVRSKIERLQETMGGSGCYLTPQPIDRHADE